MNNGNWLRNQLPFSMENFHLHIVLWKPNKPLKNSIFSFRSPALAFSYCSKTVTNKNFSARSTHTQFVRVQSYEHLFRVYDAHQKVIRIIHLSDFRPSLKQQLTWIKTQRGGMPRQDIIDRQESDNSVAEEGLIQTFFASVLFPVCFARKHHDPDVPRSFSYHIWFF